MGYIKAFRDNTNGVNHPCNVTSHVSTPSNVLGEDDQVRRSTKMWQKQQKFKVNTLSDFSRVRPPNAMGCLLGTWEVIGKESCGF